MKLRTILAVASSAVVLALSASASETALAEPQGSWSGHGEISIGTGNASWCLGIRSTQITKTKRPVVYDVPCNAAGTWQLNWVVLLFGSYPYYTAEISPVNAVELCLSQLDTNNTAALQPCNDTFILRLRDIAPRLDQELIPAAILACTTR
jgi:hypothetical protein